MLDITAVNRRRSPWLTSLVAWVLLAACSTTNSSTSAMKLVGERAPEFALSTLDDREVSLASLRGKIVILDIWACWCKGCRKELPLLDDLARRRKADGVEVVAVSIDQERSQVERMLARRPSWSLTVLQDPSGALAQRYHADSLPAVYLIDRGGRIRYHGQGIDENQMVRIERELEALLE